MLTLESFEEAAAKSKRSDTGNKADIQQLFLRYDGK